MLETLPTVRPDLSKYAPRITTVKVKPDQIRLIIGPGGKTIKGIVDAPAWPSTSRTTAR